MPFSKQDLQDLYSLTLEEVEQTLTSCNLDLDSEDYSEAEIEQKFTRIRNYFEREEVSSYLEAKKRLFQELAAEQSQLQQNSSDREVESLVNLIESLSPGQAEKIIKRLEARGSAISDRITAAFENGLITQLTSLAKSGELDRRINKSLGESRNTIDIEVIEAQDQPLLSQPKQP